MKTTAIKALERAGFRAIEIVVRAVVKVLATNPASLDVIAAGTARMNNAIVDLARTGHVVPPTPFNVRSFYDALRNELDELTSAQAEAENRNACDYLDVLRAAVELARVGQLETMRDAGELKKATAKLHDALTQASLVVEIEHAPEAGPSWNGRRGRFAHDQDGHSAVIALTGSGVAYGQVQEIPDALYAGFTPKHLENFRTMTVRRILVEAAKRCMSPRLSDAQKSRAFVVLEGFRHVLAYEGILGVSEATTLSFATAREELFQRVVNGFAAH